MAAYILIWLLVFVISVPDVFKPAKTVQDIFLMVLFAVLLLFIGTRFETGPDLDVYHTYYRQSPLFWEALTNYKAYAYIPVEPLYLLINAGAKSLGLTFNGYLLCYSFFFMIPVFHVVRKYSVAPLISILVYYYYGYFSGFSVLRQVMAAAVFFYGIQFIIERKLWKYILCMLLASCFHISALILIPLYFLVHKNFKAAHILILVFIAIILRQLGFFKLISDVIGSLLSFSPITVLLFQKFLLYSDAGEGFWGSVTMEWVGIIIFVLFNRRALEVNTPHFNIFFNIFVIGIMMYAFFGAFGDFGRIIIYFKLAYLILIPGLLSLFKDYKWKFAVLSLFSLLVLLRVYVSVISDSNLPDVMFNRYMPYKTWLLN